MASNPVSDQRFAESKHRYTDPRSRERLISVTTVVGCFDSGDKLGAGAGAAVKLTKAGLDYRKEWNGKRDLGTRVHKYAELWINNKTADVLESDMPYMDAFADWCREKKPEWIVVERAVVSSLGYGGKFDVVVFFDDAYWLLDFKSGKPYKMELTLQLAGYRFADGMIRYDADGKSVGLDPLPHIDRCAGLYLGGDGKATLVECQVDEAAFQSFKNLLAVKQWSKTVEKDS